MPLLQPPDDRDKGYDQKSVLQPRTSLHPPLPPPVAPHGRGADPHLGLGLGAAVDVPGRPPGDVAAASAAAAHLAAHLMLIVLLLLQVLLPSVLSVLSAAAPVLLHRLPLLVALHQLVAALPVDCGAGQVGVRVASFRISASDGSISMDNPRWPRHQVR